MLGEVLAMSDATGYEVVGYAPEGITGAGEMACTTIGVLAFEGVDVAAKHETADASDGDGNEGLYASPLVFVKAGENACLVVEEVYVGDAATYVGEAAVLVGVGSSVSVGHVSAKAYVVLCAGTTLSGMESAVLSSALVCG